MPCLRGRAQARLLYARERLLKPLRRVGPRGSDEFEEVAWDQALDEVAERLNDVRDRYGTEAEKIAAQKDSKEYAPLESLPDYSVGEIEYIAENECIRHISDLVRRRSVIAITGRASEAVLKELVDVVGRVLNWNQRRRQAEVEIALEDVASRK